MVPTPYFGLEKVATVKLTEYVALTLIKGIVNRLTTALNRACGHQTFYPSFFVPAV